MAMLSQNSSILSVGTGRGFVVEGSLAEYGLRYVITSGSCLPISGIKKDPPASEELTGFDKVANKVFATIADPMAAMGRPAPTIEVWPPLTWEREACENIIGTLGAEIQPVDAQCIFYDPICNLAVLGSPSNREYERQDREEAYKKLVGSVSAVRLSNISKDLPFISDDTREASAYIFNLDGNVHECKVSHRQDLIGARGVPDGMWFHRGIQIGPNRLPAHFGDGMGKLLGSPIFLSDDSVCGVVTGIQQGVSITEHLPRWLVRELVGRKEDESELE